MLIVAMRCGLRTIEAIIIPNLWPPLTVDGRRGRNGLRIAMAWPCIQTSTQAFAQQKHHGLCIRLIISALFTLPMLLARVWQALLSQLRHLTSYAGS